MARQGEEPAGSDPDHEQKDLFYRIEKGDLPKWPVNF
jgi:catalase